MNNTGKIFLESALKRLRYYKELGDKTLSVLDTRELNYSPNEESNSIAVIVRHMSGNMLSRWTDFLTSDGEKEWRHRDREFDSSLLEKEALLQYWEEGWNCCLHALQSLTENDLEKTIYIRSEPLSVIDAINRQLAHYPYHVGQIVFLGKLIKNQQWQSLSIPRNQSEQFNRQMKK